MNRVRTLRGRLTDTTVRRIIVDDGRTNHGYKVKSFKVWCDPTAANGVFASLGLSFDMPSGARADDNRQIAWSGNTFSSATSSLGASLFEIVDPDHVVITDLYIVAINSEGTNYLIEVEPVTLNDDEAILALIKERSQDDIR